MTTNTNLDLSIESFVERVQGLVNAHYDKHLPSLEKPVMSIMKGRKYSRIVEDNHSQRMVYCFVDRTTGDILKAESWKKPAKHARGNILSEDGGMSGVNAHGANYIC